ncbi:MAG TPA: ABC transporter permease subunit [Vicinamibacterales bacterium]|nr:ABC transporter permease subunit [Vicinamibacterales bacterium]
MRNVLTIAANETRRIFVSPLAWAVLGISQFIFGYIFSGAVIQYVRNTEMQDQAVGVSDYVGSGLYGSATIILLLILPLMTMRVFSEERKSGTLTLLFSAPVTLIEIVLGKFLGVMVFVLAMLSLLAVMPASLLPAVDLDIGRLAAGLLGLLLLTMAFAACGLFISSLTREPTIAAIGSFAALLLIWLLKMPASFDSQFAPLFDYLSLISHYQDLISGLFDSSDVVYYLLFTALFLWLTVLRLDMERN